MWSVAVLYLFCSFTFTYTYTVPYTVVGELGVNIILVIMFKMRLDHTVKQTVALHRDNQGISRSILKMKFVRSKQLVLVATTCASTLFATLLFWGVFHAGLFAADMVINSICVLMMGPYYSHYKQEERGREWLYRMWCRPCIFCFCSASSLGYYEGGKSPSPKHASPTMETMSAPRVLTKTLDLEAGGTESNQQNIVHETDDSEAGRTTDAVEVASPDGVDETKPPIGKQMSTAL